MTAKSTNVGKDTEQRLARWLRESGGFPHAERTVRTGYRTAARTMPDAGDIDGTPGICWQAKSLRPADRAERAVEGWLEEVEQQRAAAHADLGLLVVRRWGTTDVGRWWCFMQTRVLGRGRRDHRGPSVPLRMELRHAAALLHAWGYGCPGIPATETRQGESA